LVCKIQYTELFAVELMHRLTGAEGRLLDANSLKYGTRMSNTFVLSYGSQMGETINTVTCICRTPHTNLNVMYWRSVD